ncbi:MAG: TIGR02186 family protein [Candidatus Omnitrophota bacterium]
MPGTRFIRWALALAAAAGIVYPCRAANLPGAMQLDISANRVEIGLFYRGAEIAAEAVAPVGLDVVMVCMGPEERLELKKKGKAWGVLWMNVGDLVFDRFPSLYILLSSGPLTDIAPEATPDGIGLGYPALLKRVVCGDPENQGGRLFEEAIKLKEQDGLFHIGEGEIVAEPAGEGLQKIKGRFFLPPKAPPAEYKIMIWGLRQKTIQVQSLRSLVLAKTGAIAHIASAAKEHGLAYGCASVFLALMAGLFTGWIFSGRSSKTH